MNNILFVGEHPRTYDVRWHKHDFWELVYCTSGQGAFKFENGAVMNYRAGEAVAIPPNELHANSSQEGFTNIHLTIQDPSFPFRGSFLVSDDTERHLEIAFSQAKYYFSSDVRKRELVLAALGELISSYMIVYHSNREFSEPVDQIRTSIIQNYADPAYALDEAIRRMPFNYDYLRKLFKKEMGVTPLEYMIRLRMKKAETMLTAMWNNEYSIAEVAEQCGFDDALYFSRVFKKNFGCSPSKFAKSGNKGSEGGQERKEP